MKRNFLLLLTLLLAISMEAKFDDWFLPRTLRMDYVFSGDSIEQRICLDELFQLPYWAGRRNNLDSLHLEGNGQILMTDVRTGKLLYAHSFSTLFQEWQHTDEAKHTYKSFENCFLLPFPKSPVNVTVQLRDSHRRITSTQTTKVDPSDILIRPLYNVQALKHRYILQSGTPEACIDIAILAEGYREDQMNDFYRDAQAMTDQLFAHEPFKQYKNRFNIVAVESASIDEGTSVPHKNVWKRTALSSHFDTFYSERYLTTLHLKKMQDLLTGIPYEHVIVLVNSEVYGGGGIFNLYMLSTIHHQYSLPVCVHEFGHSFAGLADEYGYDDTADPYYHAGVEPWEKNITTLADFSQKWADMVPKSTPVPTPENKNVDKEYETVGVFEGAGYLTKGVYRPAQDCRMKVNNVPAFCPVCQRAIKEVIEFYTR